MALKDIVESHTIIIIAIILMLIAVAYISGLAQQIGVFGQKQGQGVASLGTEALKEAEKYAKYYNTKFFIEKKIDLTKTLYSEELAKLETEIPQLSSTDLVCNTAGDVYISDEMIVIEGMQLNSLYCAKMEPSSCVWCKGGFQFTVLNLGSLNKNCCDITKLLLENLGLRSYLLYIVYPTEERLYMALIDVNGDVFLTTIDWDLQSRAIVAYEQKTYFNNINYLHLKIAPGWSRLSLKRLLFYAKDMGNLFFIDKFNRNPVKKYVGYNFNAECAGEKINIRIYSKRVDVKVFSAVRLNDDGTINYSATVYIRNANVVIKDRKIYKTKRGTSIIYLPKKALEGFNLGREKSEVRTIVFVQLDKLFIYNCTTTLLPQYSKGEYAYKYYYMQIPAKLVQTIESDIEDWGLEIEDLNAEVQLIQGEKEGEKGLKALILLKPEAESD